MPVINPIHAASELKHFMEAFNDDIKYFKDKLKKWVKQLGEEELSHRT